LNDFVFFDFFIIKIIPAILEQKFDQIVEKIKRVENEAPNIKWVQLDIMDNKFVPNYTWNRPAELSSIKTNLNFEVHLMIENPKEHLFAWLNQSKIKRVLIHQEAEENDKNLVKSLIFIKNHNIKAGVVLNPKTDIKAIQNYLEILDCVLLMGVEPGFSGQVFDKQVLAKICKLRQLDSQIPIAIDGGVNLETAPKIVQAGANILCIGSFFWKSKNIAQALDQLNNVLAKN